MSTPVRRSIEAKLSTARHVLNTTRRLASGSGSSIRNMAAMTKMLAEALGRPEGHFVDLLRAAGIEDPLRTSLTPVRIKRFLAAYRTRLDGTSTGVDLLGQRWADEFTLDRTRQVLHSLRAQFHDHELRNPTIADLQRHVANTLGWTSEHTDRLLIEVGIGEPLRDALDRDHIDQFVAAASASPADYPAPPFVPDPERITLERRRRQQKEKDQKRAQASQDAPLLGAQRESMKQQTERLMREREEQLRARLKHTKSRPIGQVVSRLAPTDAPTPLARTAALPACRRLVSGNASGNPAQLTADLYLGIAELAVYRATATQAAAAQIAAEHFGVHTDVVTASDLHARAGHAFARETGGEMLDHLSRLARRPRGLFYDAHLDRLTLWEIEDSTMTVYTCMVAELRRHAAVALELGDLALPRLAKRVINSRTVPDRADDPALILAVAAEQLGRQSEIARRRAEVGSGVEPASPPAQVLVVGPTYAQNKHQSRTSPVWVVPVAGTHENLEINRMDASYTRHVPGPRSRAATMVREHMRRSAGSSPYAQPTIKVRAHPRRGT